MAVHGSDGVHIKYCTSTNRLLLFFGESKLYSDVAKGIARAVESIVDAYSPDKMKHEIDLVTRNMDVSGLPDQIKDRILRYLDPYDEAYNERHDVSTCLVGFDFDAFAKVVGGGKGVATADERFRKLATTALEAYASTLSKALKANGLDKRSLEIFFLPVPSVQELRDMFQAKIGWKI